MAFDRQVENSPATDAEAARDRHPVPKPGVPDLAGQLLQLQATGGNQAVGRLLSQDSFPTNAPVNQMSVPTPQSEAEAGHAREGLVGQVNGLAAELPAGGVRLTAQELADLNSHLGKLGSLLGRPLPRIAAGAVVAAPTIAEILAEIAAGVTALSLAELLLVIAAIIAVVVMIILLLRAAIRRPEPAPPAETSERTGQDQPEPEHGPKRPGPVPIPVPPPPRAIFGPVRAANTPDKMADRIPDAGVVDVTVQIINWNPALGPIRITIDGTAGSADFAGAPETVVTGPSGILPVHGARQSPPASGTPLKLTARLGGNVPIGSSAGFAVAAIVQDMSVALSRIVNDASVGMVVWMH